MRHMYMYVCEILSNSQIMSYLTTEIAQTSIEIKSKLLFSNLGGRNFLKR